MSEFFEKKAREDEVKKNIEAVNRAQKRLAVLKELKKGDSVDIFDNTAKISRKRKVGLIFI